ncbi:MAG: hypothetical protein J6X49_06445 [Victivallales bacterium]|nr:hypothetical protein [Victivallales bacterium]
MALTELEKWELALKSALDSIDRELESKYGPLLVRKASRPAAGRAANPKYDGVFGLDSKFTLGYSSGSGPGYIIELLTGSTMPPSPSMKAEILDDIWKLLPMALEEAFPGRTFQLERVGERFRLTGDLDFQGK